MQTCLKYADKLYEKYSQSVDRKTQSNTWANVANELKDDGISEHDVQKLKQNVTNWIRRATVSNFIYIDEFFIYANGLENYDLYLFKREKIATIIHH